MEVVRNVARMQHLCHRLQVERKQIGLVPTWGGLHEGHLALVRKVQDLVDITIVSILAPSGDVAIVANDQTQAIALTNDVEFLVPTNIDYVFAPKMQEFRDPEAATDIIVRGYSERLFGPIRPGFYTEVTNLLATLFIIVNPQVVCLGQKDPQVVAITNHLISDLQFSCQLLVTPIVREPDGTAASWWLPLLTSEQRQAASIIYKALEKAQVLFGAGERNAYELVEAIREVLNANLQIQTDYAGIVDATTLEPLANIDETPALAAVAVTIGDAHLIDNIPLNE